MTALAVVLPALAAAPTLISYQARLQGTSGPITTPTSVRFRLWSGGDGTTIPSGGTLVYHETVTVTPSSEGVFSHMVGSGTPRTGCAEGTCLLSPSDFPDAATPLWLEVMVDPDGTLGSGDDDILIPRTRIVTVGYAMHADTLDGRHSTEFIDTSGTSQTKSGTLTVSDLSCSDCINSTDIAPSAVGTSEIADGSIVSADVLDGGLGGMDIADGTITSNDLAANSVDASKILDGGVGAAEIATDAVGSAEIAADAVGSSEIGASAVGSSEIADSSVASIDILDGTVTGSDVADNSLTANDLAADSVGNSEIAADAVSLSKIAAGTFIVYNNWCQIPSGSGSATRCVPAFTHTATTGQRAIAWSSIGLAFTAANSLAQLIQYSTNGGTSWSFCGSQEWNISGAGTATYGAGLAANCAMALTSGQTYTWGIAIGGGTTTGISYGTMTVLILPD
jgi:hypothetical protein